MHYLWGKAELWMLDPVKLVHVPVTALSCTIASSVKLLMYCKSCMVNVNPDKGKADDIFLLV